MPNPPRVQYPPPPCNVFPSLSFDLPGGWAHVMFTDHTLNGFEGSMTREKRQGDERSYRFEARYENGVWKAVPSACDPDNPNPFEDRNMGSGSFRPIQGFRTGDRSDIARRAEDLAARLRKQVEDERKWLLNRFAAATLILPTVRYSAYALDGEWLICRNRIMLDDGFDVSAERRGFSFQQAQDFVAGRHAKVRPLAPSQPQDPTRPLDFRVGSLDREIAADLSDQRLRKHKLASGHPDDCECNACDAAGDRADLDASRQTLKILKDPVLVKKWRDVFDQRDREWALQTPS